MYQNIYVDKKKHDVYLWDDERGLLTFDYKPYAYKASPTGRYRGLFGEKLERVTRYRHDADDTYESDVPMETRVLIDLYEDSDEASTNHVILNFDIEVSMEGQLPDTETGNNEITSIAMQNKATDEYWVLILDKDCVLDNVSRDDCEILAFPDEISMLDSFLDIYRQINPTILTGWNIDFFDIPYLYHRICRVMGDVYARQLSPIGEVTKNQFKQRIIIAGVSCLDYLSLYKKFTFTDEPSYRLDAIGKKEVNMGKVEYTGTLDKLFKEDINKFIEYNLHDVKIVSAIDDKMDLIELCRSICHVGHVPYEEISFSSRYLEGALLTYMRRNNLVAPNKDPNGREKFEELKDSGEEGFEGAYVKEPIPGKYNWIFDLDLTSLYPSIIMSLNISPETKVGVADGWSPDKVARGELDSVRFDGREYDIDDFQDMLKEHNLSISSSGAVYVQDKKGIIPSILEQWFNQRVEYKDEMKRYGKAGDDAKYGYYKRLQHVQKILLNSLYGVLGLPVFRFYDPDNALAVTSTGQTIIKTTADVLNIKYNKELGGEVIIENDNGDEIRLWERSNVRVLRNGVEMDTLAGDILETDELIL